MSTFCQRSYHRNRQRRGVGGQKKTNLVNVVCERPLRLSHFPASSFFSCTLYQNKYKTLINLVTYCVLSMEVALQRLLTFAPTANPTLQKKNSRYCNGTTHIRGLVIKANFFSVKFYTEFKVRLGHSPASSFSSAHCTKTIYRSGN